MLSGNFDIEDFKKKKKKTALSITIDTDSLEFLKQDMKEAGIKNISISSVFDTLLKNFIEYRKDIKQKEQKEDDKKKK